MESLSLRQLEVVQSILEDIVASINHLQVWNKDVLDFLDLESSEEGLQKLAADAMLIEAIGEAVKQLDSKTEGKLLSKYAAMPWRQIKGMRDRIAHGYFDLDTNFISDIIVNDLPELKGTIEDMLVYVKQLVAAK